MTSRRVLVAFGVALILASFGAAGERSRGGYTTMAPEATPTWAAELPPGYGSQLTLPRANAISTLYTQAPNGNYAIAAQNFEGAYDYADTEIGDSINVPAGPNWVVEQFIFHGFHWNAGATNVQGVNVWVYNAVGGYPGTLVCGPYLNAVPVNPLDNNVTVNICPPMTACTLAAGGSYVFTMQVNMPFGSYGQWGLISHTPVVNTESIWRNTGGGFGTPCNTNWGFRCTVCNVPSQPYCLTSTDDDAAFTVNTGACGGSGGGGGGQCNLAPIEAKLDDEARFTSDAELAVIEGKLDNLEIDWCDLIDLLLPLLHETLPTTHPCYP